MAQAQENQQNIPPVMYVQQDGVLFDKKKLEYQIQKSCPVVQADMYGTVTTCTKCHFACIGSHDLVRHYNDVHQQKIWCYNSFCGIPDDEDMYEHLEKKCRTQPCKVVLVDLKSKCKCTFKDIFDLEDEDCDITTGEKFPSTSVPEDLPMKLVSSLGL